MSASATSRRKWQRAAKKHRLWARTRCARSALLLGLASSARPCSWSRHEARTGRQNFVCAQATHTHTLTHEHSQTHPLGIPRLPHSPWQQNLAHQTPGLHREALRGQTSVRGGNARLGAKRRRDSPRPRSWRRDASRLAFGSRERLAEARVKGHAPAGALSRRPGPAGERPPPAGPPALLRRGLRGARLLGAAPPTLQAPLPCAPCERAP